MSGDSVREAHAACDDCLRHSWLLSRLSARLDYCALAAAGRLEDVLALDDRALIEAMAGSRRTELLQEHERFDPAAGRREGNGHASICRHDRGFPGRLRHPGAPRMLHVAGGVERLLTLAEGPVVAIVGASRASDYGLAVASSLARDLAASGVTVASLLCDGIATAAQSGALNARAGTMAVLGGGLDRGFPARKRALYGWVLEYGCVVAELPGAERGRRWGPIAAERVLAGLADAMVVVESTSDPSLMSGVATARALERVVAAVPGRVTSPLSGGTNALLAGGAPLVRDAADVLELLSCPPLRSGCETGTSAGDSTAGLPGRLRAILEAVGAGRDTPDQLSRGGGNPGEVLLALSELELLGLLVRGDGGRYLPSGAIGRVRSQAQADRPSERCRADADGEA